jgi:hypothetical protein
MASPDFLALQNDLSVANALSARRVRSAFYGYSSDMSTFVEFNDRFPLTAAEGISGDDFGFTVFAVPACIPRTIFRSTLIPVENKSLHDVQLSLIPSPWEAEARFEAGMREPDPLQPAPRMNRVFSQYRAQKCQKPENLAFSPNRARFSDNSDPAPGSRMAHYSTGSFSESTSRFQLTSDSSMMSSSEDIRGRFQVFCEEDEEDSISVLERKPTPMPVLGDDTE